MPRLTTISYLKLPHFVWTLTCCVEKQGRHKRLYIGNKLKQNIGHLTKIKKAQFKIDSMLKQ